MNTFFLVFLAILSASQGLVYEINDNASGKNSVVVISKNFSSSSTPFFDFPPPSTPDAPHLHKLKYVPFGDVVLAYDEPTGAYGQNCGSESAFNSVGTGKLFYLDAANNISKVILDVSGVSPLVHAVVDVALSPSGNVAFALAAFHQGPDYAGNGTYYIFSGNLDGSAWSNTPVSSFSGKTFVSKGWIAAISDLEVLVSQSCRCNNCVPKLYKSVDGGSSFNEIDGPMSENPAAFVDYRGFELTPAGLVANCYVCFLKSPPPGCVNATFFTAIYTNSEWTVYPLATIDWTFHCYSGSLIYSVGIDPTVVTAFDPITASPVANGTLPFETNGLFCGGATDDVLAKTKKGLYKIAFDDGVLQTALVQDFQGQNITNVVA